MGLIKDHFGKRLAKDWQNSKVDTPLVFILSEREMLKIADIDDLPEQNIRRTRKIYLPGRTGDRGGEWRAKCQPPAGIAMDAQSVS